MLDDLQNKRFTLALLAVVWVIAGAAWIWLKVVSA